MLFKGNFQLNNRKKLGTEVDKVDGGVNSLFSQSRLNKNEAVELTNMILVEDGLPDKRWGTRHFGGVTWTNRPDGSWIYRKTNGTVELIVVADGYAWRVDPESSTKTQLTGATFTSGYPCDAIQISTKLYVCNGEDVLAVYNGTDFDVYTELSAPAWGGTPLARGAGLAAGAITLYYRVTAVNEVGETTPNAEQSITVDIARFDWDEADEYITLDWAAVSGATKYIIYFSDASGYEVKLAETTDTTFQDDGTYSENPYIEPPTANTTGGPKFSTICLAGNRIIGCKDPDNPYRVYYSGTGVNLGNFSSGYGGGWIDLEYGGLSITTKPTDFQSVLNVFCKTDDGRGTIWQLPFESVVVGSELIIVPQPQKIISGMGCGDPRTIVYVENDVMFWNHANGVNVLGNEPGVLDVLRTNELSSKIRNYVRAIPNTGDKCGYYFNSKVLFSYRSSTSEANHDYTTVFDRERNCWIKIWTVGVSQFLEYPNSTGQVSLLGIADDRLVEFSENVEGDQGVAFAWKYLGPRFPMGNDWSEFGRRFKAWLKLRSVTGTINVKVYGTTKTTDFSAVSSQTVEGALGSAGMGWDVVGDFQLGDTSGDIVAFDSDSILKYLIVNGLLREIQLEVSGTGIGDRAVIMGYQFKGIADKTAKPLSMKL